MVCDMCKCNKCNKSNYLNKLKEEGKKICSRCKEVKDQGCFDYSSKGTLGNLLRSECKVCRKIYNAKAYLARKEKKAKQKLLEKEKSKEQLKQIISNK